MKLSYKLATAAFAFVASTTAAHAQTEVNEWTIFSNPGTSGNCRAISNFAKGITVSITLYTSGRATMMFLDSETFKSVSDHGPVDGQLVFVRGEDLDTKWSTLELSGVVLADEKASKGAYLNVSAGADLVNTVGTSEIFGLIRGEDVLISIKPDNPAALAKGLRDCVVKL